MYVPENDYHDPLVIPRGKKWSRNSKGRKEGGKDLTAYRAFLDQLRENQVASAASIFLQICHSFCSLF